MRGRQKNDGILSGTSAVRVYDAIIYAQAAKVDDDAKYEACYGCFLRVSPHDVELLPVLSVITAD